MTAVRLALLEFRRFRGPLRTLVPIALALIPLLYGSLYLWSNWDPYGRTDKIPVAVVNQDHPAEANGQLVDAGKQFTDQLRASGAFQWHFVDARAAHEGLEHGRYYFTITVPPDFSAKLVSAQRPTPERASLDITLDDANNFVVGIIAKAAKSELQDQVNSAAHAAYARAIYGELSQVKQQLHIAAIGAHALVDGTVLAQRTGVSLTDGITAARAGAAGITDGLQRLADAGTRADQAIDALAGSGATALPNAVGAAVNAATAASQTMGVVQDGTALVRQSAADADAALRQFAAVHPELALDPLLATALQRAHSLGDAAAGAAGTAEHARTAADQAATAATAVQRDFGPVQTALTGSDSPLRAISSSTRQIGSGATQITAGLTALESGAQTLRTAADQLNNGATQLAGVVDGAVQKIPDTSAEQTAKAADVLGSPVGISMDNLHPAGVYGRGLAPFFFSIAIWVVGLLAYLFLRPLNPRALAGRVGTLTVAAAGWLPVAAIAAIGGVILYGAVHFGLHLNPVHPIAVAGVLILAAGAFVAIDHFLRVSLGAIGEALSLVLLIVQLTACGGLYPIETTPAPFRAVHPILPMTYLVDALRVGISGGLTTNLVRDVLVLAGFLLVFVGATALVVRRQRVWTVARLHPRIET
ncbi:YhgE/Pip domain-containing protein [Nocardia sp. CDC159]|uniref:YhgE/Pip domain-containing protein n=1 Tax=Nocardia pulmonis TaxID=2951408 RepID=A0A9X2EHJ2_9NOCA|nr:MULTISPECIES: YhgE/Pip domain-containing protein [Nocardia]MCM6778201.1 YhgE/Pip domain-containing protein [Nocardia pulmonis]MCM6791090.1 YhgE/Pip domain-containing protein [Nocardia sp. CDC159]